MSLMRFAISSSTRCIALGNSSTVIFSYAVFLIFAINRGNSFRSTSMLVLTRWFCSLYSCPARCAASNTFCRCSSSWYVCRLWRWRCCRLAAALFNWCDSWMVRCLFLDKLSFNSWSIWTSFASRSPLFNEMQCNAGGGTGRKEKQRDEEKKEEEGQEEDRWWSHGVNQSINQSINQQR